MLPNYSTPDPEAELVAACFDTDILANICVLPEEEFGAAFGLIRYEVPDGNYGVFSRGVDEDFYFHRDNGSNVLAVAHLDTVVSRGSRKARFVETDDGLVVHSGALDDRLGAYVILDMLPKLGITCDLLLTVGEESGCSTAEHFEPPKQYDWMIEFDRGGTDVVMYQYDDHEVRELVRDSGAKVGDGIFSDICYLEHLGIKGFNWGVGYRDYHGPRGYAYLEDTFEMVASYVRFHEDNLGTYMPHYAPPRHRAARNWWEDAEYGGETISDAEAEEEWRTWEEERQARSPKPLKAIGGRSAEAG